MACQRVVVPVGNGEKKGLPPPTFARIFFSNFLQHKRCGSRVGDQEFSICFLEPFGLSSEPQNCFHEFPMDPPPTQQVTKDLLPNQNLKVKSFTSFFPQTSPLRTFQPKEGLGALKDREAPGKKDRRHLEDFFPEKPPKKGRFGPKILTSRHFWGQTHPEKTKDVP